jgi:O-antigen/teichoic acid export membrane protein
MSSINADSSRVLTRQVISIFVQIISIALIARQLGVEGNGKYALIILIPTFMSLILSMSLNASNIFFIKRKENSQSQVYTTSMVVAFVVATLGMTLGSIIILFYGANFFPKISIDLLFMALFIFPFMLFNSLQLSFLLAAEDFSKFNIASLVQPFLFLIIILILNLLDFFNLSYIVSAFLTSSVVAILVNNLYILKLKYVFSIKFYSKSLKNKLLSYGLRSHAANLVAFVNYRADIFFLGVLSSLTSVGLYYAAIQIAERLGIFSEAISTVLFPKLVAMKGAQRLSLTIEAFKASMIITFLAAVFLCMFGYYLILAIFGEEYLAAYFVLLVLAPGMVLGSGSRILANAISAKGAPELNAYTALLSMIVNIILNIVLIPKYDYMGAAIATSVAYTATFTLRLFVFKRLEKTFLIKIFIIRFEDFINVFNKIFLIIKGKKS